MVPREFISKALFTGNEIQPDRWFYDVTDEMTKMLI